jgi:uncharacterized membrane protein
MIGNETDDRSRLDRIRRYRRLMYGSILVGVLGFVAGSELDYPLVGLAVYWAGILGFVAVWKGTSVTLFDERDAALERRASHVTLQVAGVVGVLTMTSMVVLEEATTTGVSERVWGGFLALSGLFVLYGVVYLFLRYRR